MSVAGGALRDELAAQVANRIAPAPLYLMYGQAEATARLAALPPAQLHARRDSIGKPIRGVELSVRDDAGRELPAGAIGMLCARGDNVMLGYWQDAGGDAPMCSPATAGCAPAIWPIATRRDTSTCMDAPIC